MHKGLVTPAAFALMVWAELACGQDPRGSILGRVTDSSNAVVPGVEVRATNVATGVTASGVANEGGSYNIPFLLPGTYRIRAEIPGFKTYVRDGIQVRVSETVELNIQMEVGQISETVIATAETPLLDTAGSSLGQVVDERRVLELPLFAGNPMELTLLTPGVVNTTDMRLRKAAFNNAPSQIATDGNGQYNNEFQIDGVSNTFAVGNGTARVAFSPPATAIKEFKIETSPYDASVGHTIGAVTNVSTAGGTNELHGEAHFWERNSAFDAPNFFNNKNNTRPAVYQDHRYGASAGAPVVLPGLRDGRNRTFWYYAWESNKWGVPGTQTSTVPTPAERRGDFSELLRLGSRYQIYDPATTTPAADSAAGPSRTTSFRRPASIPSARSSSVSTPSRTSRARPTAATISFMPRRRSRTTTSTWSGSTTLSATSTGCSCACTTTSGRRTKMTSSATASTASF